MSGHSAKLIEMADCYFHPRYICAAQINKSDGLKIGQSSYLTKIFSVNTQSLLRCSPGQLSHFIMMKGNVIIVASLQLSIQFKDRMKNEEWTIATGFLFLSSFYLFIFSSEEDASFLSFQCCHSQLQYKTLAEPIDYKKCCKLHTKIFF